MKQPRTAARIAEQLTKEWGIKRFPVDPSLIADQHDILIKAMPSSSGKGVSGMLIYNHGQFGILYATHIDNEGFQRFSIAHELGHYFLPGHPESVMQAGIHESLAADSQDDPYEKEADQFASGILMPTYLFDPAIDDAGNGMTAIKSLSNLCKTSLTTTSIQYVKRTTDIAAVIVSVGNKVSYSFVSEELSEYPIIHRPKKGDYLPNTSTKLFNSDPQNISQRKESSSLSSFQTWFGGNVDGELCEEIIGLGNYNRTLTILSNSSVPNLEEIEEDQELIDSWTPRFRK